ncbi:hypothetical protein Gorai_003689, partial [Gossypium raimondii]|nr:hypothetical protein [Gossypium raimondii]
MVLKSLMLLDCGKWEIASFPATVDVDFPHTTESYRLYSQRVIASDIKECVCRAPDTPYDESAYSNIPMTPYELPDGQTIEIGADRFKIPDILFNPPLAQTIPGMDNFAEISPSVRGLPQMVIESINRCDVDIRKELFGSILLAGGTASMQQLKERLEKDLLEESPQAARVKVLASGNATERRFRFACLDRREYIGISRFIPANVVLQV